MTVAIVFASIIVGIGIIVISLVISSYGGGYQKAVGFFNRANYDAALVILEKLSRSPSANPDSRWYLARTYEAKRFFDKAIRLYTDLLVKKVYSEVYREFDVRTRLAEIYLKREEIDAAEREIKAMAKLKPDSSAVQVKLAELTLAKGDYAAGSVALKKALSLDPHNGTVARALGMAYFSMEKHAEALAVFSRAIELGTSDAEMSYTMGLAARGISKLVEAVRYFDQAAKNPAWSQRARLKAAITNFEIGDLTTAIPMLEDAVAKGGSNDDMLDAMYILGQGRTREGKLDKALDLWRRISNIDPDFRDVPEKLKDFGKIKGVGNELDSLLMLPLSDFKATLMKVAEKMGHRVIKEIVDGEKIIFHTTFKDGTTIFENVIEAVKSANPIGELHIRELLARMKDNRADRGIYFGPAGFTEAAQKASERYAVDLVSGEKFKRLLGQIKR